MDETMYDYQRSDVAAASRRFPARRPLTHDLEHAPELGAFGSAPGTDFAQHAWDESGVL